MQEGEARGIEKGLQEGKAQGRSEGLQEGEAKGRLSIARTLLAEGMSAEKTAQITGLPIEQVREIKI